MSGWDKGIKYWDNHKQSSVCNYFIRRTKIQLGVSVSF